jgi:Amt family ammonium transporter
MIPCAVSPLWPARHLGRRGMHVHVLAVRNAMGYDEALDVFGVHCIGAIGTGILASPSLGGAGIFDYAIGKVANYDMVTQVITQAKTVCLTLVWPRVGSAILFTVVKALVGLRPRTDHEREGLDLVDHANEARLAARLALGLTASV